MIPSPNFYVHHEVVSLLLFFLSFIFILYGLTGLPLQQKQRDSTVMEIME